MIWIGDLNNSDYFFSVVAKGHTFSRIERKHETSMEGEKLPLDVVEIYYPNAEQEQRYSDAVKAALEGGAS